MTVSNVTTVVVGSYTFTSTDTDGTPDPLVAQLRDGVSIVARSDQPWPMPGTESATFALWAPTSEHLNGIIRGVPVSIDYATPASAPVTRARFAGTVTDVVLATRADGVLLEVTAMDHLTTALAENVGDEPWPAEPVADRVARIMGLLGLTYSHTTDLPLPGGGVATLSTAAPGHGAMVRARDVDAQPALALLTTLLDGWAVDWSTDLTTLGYPAGSGLGRFVLRPVVGFDGSVSSWETVPRLAALLADASYPLPGAFGFAEGGYGVTFPNDASRAPGLVPAGMVDLASEYTQRPNTRPNRVSVGWWDTASGTELTTTASSGGSPAVPFHLSTELTSSADALRAGQLYLPASSTSEWYASDFTWHWGRDAGAHADPMPELGELVVVAPIPTRHTPPRATDGVSQAWYAGVLTGRVVQLADASPVLALTITPELRPLAGQASTGLSWADLPAGVTWDNLNARDTWDDYRLVRG